GVRWRRPHRVQLRLSDHPCGDRGPCDGPGAGQGQAHSICPALPGPSSPVRRRASTTRFDVALRRRGAAATGGCGSAAAPVACGPATGRLHCRADMKRRAFLSLPTLSAGSLAAAALPAWPMTAWADAAAPKKPADRFASEELEAHDLQVPGRASLARRALVLAPRHLKAGTRPRALVLLHGLGETGNEALGIRAWAELYGLISAYERLRRPPLERILPRARYATDERLEELNRSLAARPFEGLLLICPVTPNPYKPGPAARTLDAYTEWLFDSLLPTVRERVGPFSALGIDGCSLGGYAALEVFLRRPTAFATLGSVQGAFG